MFCGAALEGVLGDELVANGVELVSRSGSSKSGCINSFFHAHAHSLSCSLFSVSQVWILNSDLVIIIYFLN